VFSTLILILVFRGTENVSFELILKSSFSILIVHKPFCENKIVGSLKIRSSILPFMDFKILKLKPVL
jgi:hypothetical protein